MIRDRSATELLVHNNRRSQHAYLLTLVVGDKVRTNRALDVKQHGNRLNEYSISYLDEVLNQPKGLRSFSRMGKASIKSREYLSEKHEER